MTRMVRISFALLIAIVCISKPSYAKQKLSDDDIEETSELVVNHLEPLLELHGLTLEDVPNHLKYLTAKHYLIFSREEEPLDILEQMISDYQIILDSQQTVAVDFQKNVEHFIELNKANNKKALNKFVTNIMDNFNFHLQVVSPRDAVKFLLYQEAYPDVMDLISLMVSKHYEAYLKERAKDKGQSNLNNNNKSVDSDDFDLTAIVRQFVASHGRLGLIKRLLVFLEQSIPPVDQESITESTLDYLDELHDYLEVKIYSFWNFINGSSYTTTTDKWITRLEEMLRDFLTVVPFQEILNYFDAIALSSTDRLALIIFRYERRLAMSETFFGQHIPSVTNAEDIFDIICEKIFFAFTSIQETLRATISGEYSELSQETFLKYIDELLNPYDMSTNDLSKEMLSIISRTFKRINSAQDASLSDTEQKTVHLHTKSIRENLEKLRDALKIVIPQKSEAYHIELETLLQTVVNKYGALALQVEAIFVEMFNNRNEHSEDKEIIAEDISVFAQKLNTIALGFQESGTKPSELIKKRLQELVEIIDGFVMFASF